MPRRCLPRGKGPKSTSGSPASTLGKYKIFKPGRRHRVLQIGKQNLYSSFGNLKGGKGDPPEESDNVKKGKKTIPLTSR